MYTQLTHIQYFVREKDQHNCVTPVSAKADAAVNLKHLKLLLLSANIFFACYSILLKNQFTNKSHSLPASDKKRLWDGTAKNSLYIRKLSPREQSKKTCEVHGAPPETFSQTYITLL